MKRISGAGLLMHELCHLIHQHVLPDGLDNQDVKSAFAKAEASGKYKDQILRRDWIGLDREVDMAYCMVDHKEFFSEMSVTFLCDTYTDLPPDSNEPLVMKNCNPPITAPHVLKRLKQQDGRNVTRSLFGRRRVEPCNKFFPFTRRQLERYDPEVYKTTKELWLFIENWDDPIENDGCVYCFS